MQNDQSTPNDSDALPTDAPHALPAQASGTRQLGRYQIGNELVGGERLCRDRLLDRTVRVRTSDAGLADDLEREARFVARLEHAGIPAVYDVVRGDGGAIMVMRNVEGITLASAIEDARGGVIRSELASPVAVLRMMAKVCEALSAAHARGVVHRAVRPDAIVIGLHGEVVLGNWRAAMVAHERPATLRYVADMQPTQSHELDDLHTDLRAIGRCLFEALTLQPYPADKQDSAGAFTSVGASQVPERAAGIVRRAVGSDMINGYRSAAELGQDMERAAAVLQAAMVPMRSQVRKAGRRRLLAAGLVVLISGLAFGGYLLATRPSAGPDWGRPIAVEHFDDEGWRARWQPDGDGTWELREGRLVSSAPSRALLIYRQRLTPPVAIEYTGQLLPGTRACDLSVWWSEREGAPEDPLHFADGARSWQIQAGAYENQFCAIFRNPGEQRMAYNSLQLESGRDYRFRVEIDGEHMSMSIDGVEVTRYRDRFPTTSGYLALYGYFPGKAFDDVALWQKNSTGLVPATAMGDALLGFGHFNDAAAAYARVAEGDSSEAQRALFRKGLAERRAGRNDLSRSTWARLTDPDLSQAADALRLEDLFNTGQHDLFLERIAAYWRRHPAGHDEIRQQWQQAVARLIATKGTDRDLIERYLAVRDELFRDDPTSAYEATSALFYLHRYEDILRFYPNERKAVALALISLARLDEAERLPYLTTADRYTISVIKGDLAGTLQMEASAMSRAVMLCKLGRAEEVPQGETRLHPTLLHLGRAHELLAFRPLSAAAAREVLLATGQFEVAAGDGLPDVPGSGDDWRAMALLGRIEAAEKARVGEPLTWARLIRAWESGDRAMVAQLRPQVIWPANLASNSFWFDGLVIGPMIDRLGGDAPALERSLRRAVKEWKQVFSKRAWFLARAALGEVKDEEVLAMPVRSEAEAWLTLGKALRAEMADQPAEALRAYQSYADLPLHLRLLDNNTLDTQVELFVQWRLRALGR
jgi:serine/threonine protein kinase